MAHLINNSILAFISISMALNGYAQPSSTESANPMDGLFVIFRTSGMIAACRKATGSWPVTKSEIEACATTKEMEYHVKVFCALDVEPSSEYEAVLKYSFPYRKDDSDHCAKPISLSINVEGDEVVFDFPGLSNPQSKPSPNEGTLQQVEGD